MDVLNELFSIDIFKEWQNKDLFIWRPFYLDFDKCNILTCDSWKNKVWWVSQWSFLLAFYKNENDIIEEALLLRVLKPSKLPTENDVISSMVEYYKDNQETMWKKSVLDPFTKFEFSFSWLECRVLWTFYKNLDWNIKFGADNENFYSANNYKVYKLSWKLLEYVVNLPDKPQISHNNAQVEKIWVVRYSSSKRFYEKENEHADVFIKPLDILWRRTALFGMTRTWKSNTLKKIIQIIKNMSDKWDKILDKDNKALVWKIGQIIFDINWEYGNDNEQDGGTSIFWKYPWDIERYSVYKKDWFKVMKVNFFSDIESGFWLINNYFREKWENSDYINNFLAVSLEKPEDYTLNNWAKIRHDRKIAAYKCCLYKAWFSINKSEKVYFEWFWEINEKIKEWQILDPSKWLSFEDWVLWFEYLWDNYNNLKLISEKRSKEGKDWAWEELRSLLWILTRKKEPWTNTKVSWYLKLKTTTLLDLHSTDTKEPFENEIYNLLTWWKIVIIDLSQWDEDVKALYSERITKKIFIWNMQKFISDVKNNYIQFYFEEAHNLFPQKSDKDLTQIYNRIAKEWAKYKLWLVYATQEVSSISSNILKNTENWFISHLNNHDEIKELKKYYDFEDFAESLIKFSIWEDKWFARIKMLSNSFVIPVQIQKFE
jgi:hypothetical protein